MRNPNVYSNAQARLHAIGPDILKTVDRNLMNVTLELQASLVDKIMDKHANILLAIIDNSHEQQKHYK